ncbi:flagellar motility protein MotE (MotC chaperone) [Shimia isoporae]|uniref:Flagellar motility protein MotE (MotC chaperone) n=1 Tax=Shimia isoporae TaxID=647720 RepID=A0A4R1N3X0_9RHOB|nr:hypothetical protein [Shimia isoporae]TCL01437.1 flagellar motility protein MotE (MotC chaperone) [Shimia isoporae]
MSKKDAVKEKQAKAPKAARKKATRNARPPRGSLFLISTFLVASAVLRVGIGASEAIAREEGPLDSPMAAMSAPQTCEQPEDMRALMAAFDEREKRIAKKEEEIRNRMQALSVADAEVSRKLAALEEAEGKLRSVIAMAETAADDDVSRLTRVYETMKPKNVAALFEEMDPEFAAGFIARMNPDSAAGVMAGLSPHAAYSISVVLAGRNANVPTE